MSIFVSKSRFFENAICKDLQQPRWNDAQTGNSVLITK